MLLKKKLKEILMKLYGYTKRRKNITKQEHTRQVDYRSGDLAGFQRRAKVVSSFSYQDFEFVCNSNFYESNCWRS